jgi:hypothetical protein
LHSAGERGYADTARKDIHMGIVRMSEPDTLSGVYALEHVYAYTYCDHCGSFHIVQKVVLTPHRHRQRSQAGILFLCAVGLLLWSPVLSGLTAILSLIIWWQGLPRTSLACMRCGTTVLTHTNSRQLVDYDTRVIDVPEAQVHKRYIETRVY